MNFQLDIVSLTGKIFSGEVREISLPAVSGEMTVLSRHMPLVTPLTVGEVVVKKNGETLLFSIGKGVFATKGKEATLIIEDVTGSDEISEEKALEAKKKAEDLLAKGIKGEEKLQALYILRRSLVDLKIARRKKKKFF